MLHERFLQDVVFTVGNVEFEAFRPWVDFILRVVNEGAPGDPQTQLQEALLAVIKRSDVIRTRRRGATGPLASVLFQKYIRARRDPGELAKLSAEDREAELNRDVQGEYKRLLPPPLWSTDEQGRTCLRVEPPHLVDGLDAPWKKQIFTTAAEIAQAKAEWISKLAAEKLDTCLAVIVALAVDSLARRLRRCDQCQDFYFAKTDHRRAHNFCRGAHRRAYDVAHRDPKQMAAKMREWRANPMRKKRLARSRSQR